MSGDYAQQPIEELTLTSLLQMMDRALASVNELSNALAAVRDDVAKLLAAEAERQGWQSRHEEEVRRLSADVADLAPRADRAESLALEHRGMIRGLEANVRTHETFSQRREERIKALERHAVDFEGRLGTVIGTAGEALDSADAHAQAAHLDHEQVIQVQAMGEEWHKHGAALVEVAKDYRRTRASHQRRWAALVDEAYKVPTAVVGTIIALSVGAWVQHALHLIK